MAVKKETKHEEEQEVDILDILLDESNEDPISLFDEEDKEVKFEQVAIIPDGDNVYVILKPIDDVEGVADDEAIVFLVDFDEDGHSFLVIEKDEPTAIKIFDKYYQLLDEAEAEDKK